MKSADLGSNFAFRNCMKMKMTLAAALVVVACSREEVREKTADARQKVAEVTGFAAPLGQRDDPKQREQQRFDEQWRNLRSFREQQAQQAARQVTEAQKQAQQAQMQAQQAQMQAPADIKFVTGAKETFTNLDPQAIDAMPVAVPITGDVSGPSVVKTQVYLDRLHFSVGVLDGRWGRNSAIATWWYQRSRDLEPTGAVDEATFRRLAGEAGAVPAIVVHPLTEDDVKGPFITMPEDVYDKAKLDCLCYETLTEKLAEKFHSSAEFLAILNPGVELNSLTAGQSINVPNVREQTPKGGQRDIARIVVSIQGNTLDAFNAAGELVFHGPTTLGNKYDPSPREITQVARVAEAPRYHYQPKLFAEVHDSEPEANLQPGPNSPVGVIWTALKKPHFGIHGTADPDSIGYASSHGCVRLTNWDALEVGRRVAPGVPVEFLDTRAEKD